MSIRNKATLGGVIDGYEQASVRGVLLTVLGSTMSWITVEATAEAAARHDNIEAGTTTFTGTDVGFGAITVLLAVVAVAVLGIVLWRYGGAGRKTGLLVMLTGLIAGGVAVVGIVLAGSVIGAAGDLGGVSVGPGTGILVTVLGALLMLSGGALRLAAGSPAVDESDATPES